MITVGRLKKALELFDNDEAQVWINISGTMFPMCGRIDKSILMYEAKDQPGVRRGEECLTVQPCDGHEGENNCENDLKNLRN